MDTFFKIWTWTSLLSYLPSCSMTPSAWKRICRLSVTQYYITIVTIVVHIPRRRRQTRRQDRSRDGWGGGGEAAVRGRPCFIIIKCSSNCVILSRTQQYSVVVHHLPKRRWENRRPNSAVSENSDMPLLEEFHIQARLVLRCVSTDDRVHLSTEHEDREGLLLSRSFLAQW